VISGGRIAMISLLIRMKSGLAWLWVDFLINPLPFFVVLIGLLVLLWIIYKA
jgi:hypothetical protein